MNIESQDIAYWHAAATAQKREVARLRDELTAANARFAKLEMVASTASSQRDAARADAERLRGLLREWRQRDSCVSGGEVSLRARTDAVLEDKP